MSPHFVPPVIEIVLLGVFKICVGGGAGWAEGEVMAVCSFAHRAILNSCSVSVPVDQYFRCVATGALQWRGWLVAHLVLE